MKLQIKITKDILKRSMMCSGLEVGTNCAIALAIRDIFPEAYVSMWYIYEKIQQNIPTIRLPLEATNFIKRFDSLVSKPQKRLNLPEFSFEIDVPEEVINSIGIEEATEIISKSETLEIVSY